MLSAKNINVAVIGYGLSAKVFHIPLILALPNDYTLYGVVQRSPSSTDDAAFDHAGIKTWRSADDMFRDSAVDLVIISSIPSTHYSFVRQALSSGKHVVVEKPFVPSSAEARELAQLAAEKQLLLSVYQNRRWDVDFLTLQQVLKDGVLGHVAELETHYDRFRPTLPAVAQQTWKNRAEVAGGALYDLGSHLIDQVYHLFGAPKSVTGFVQVQKKGLKVGDCAPDAFTVLLRYGDEENEMLVTVKSSSLSAEDQQLRYWVRGDKGSFKKFHLDIQEDQLKAGGRPGDPGFGVDPRTNHGTLTISDDGMITRQTYPSVEPTTYVEYYRILASALQGQGEVPVRGEDAADVLRIIEMAQESSDTGRTLKW
ncbi:hypothetical protein MBLNU459_g3361t2 [Dothideomycetes sp. NU459]